LVGFMVIGWSAVLACLLVIYCCGVE
jgi:hypothetical protein